MLENQNKQLNFTLKHDYLSHMENILILGLEKGLKIYWWII